MCYLELKRGTYSQNNNSYSWGTYYVTCMKVGTMHTLSSIIKTPLESRYYYFCCTNLETETQRSEETYLRKFQIENLNPFLDFRKDCLFLHELLKAIKPGTQKELKKCCLLISN